MDDASWFSLRLSLQVALLATLLVAVLGGVTAYLLATRRFRGRTAVEVLVTLPLVLPPTVTGYLLVVLFGRHGWLGAPIEALTGGSLMFTWGAAVVASAIVAFPLMVRTAQAAIESVDRSMIDTAYTLGYSEAETAWRVVLPLARRGLLAGVSLAFARAIGEFGATLMLAGNIPGRTDTMPLAIYAAASSGDWSRAQALVLVLTLVSAALLYVAHKLGRVSW
jgi:molybdate transport system permease protein